ncbi:hypothetical protein D5272_18180 [bacterium D16-76]|nr:hypothetical protein [Acutalibacter sp. 1XD8-36]NBK80426.1 hypothetical protein [bacterium D16-76]
MAHGYFRPKIGPEKAHEWASAEAAPQCGLWTKGEDDNSRAMICGLAVALSHRRSLPKKLFPNTVTLPIFPYF